MHDRDRASVTRASGVAMQVCVPKEWDDLQVVAFANFANPSGTEQGWRVRKQGSPFLRGANERVRCQTRQDTHVHIMLDC